MKRSLLALLLIPVLLLAACGPVEPAVPTGTATGASSEATTTEAASTEATTTETTTSEATTTEAATAGPVSPEEGVELIGNTFTVCGGPFSYAEAAFLLGSAAETDRLTSFLTEDLFLPDGFSLVRAAADDAFFEKNYLLLTVDTDGGSGYAPVSDYSVSLSGSVLRITAELGGYHPLSAAPSPAPGEDAGAEAGSHTVFLTFWRVDRRLADGYALEYLGPAARHHQQRGIAPAGLYDDPVPVGPSSHRTDYADVAGSGSFRYCGAPAAGSGVILSARVGSLRDYSSVLWLWYHFAVLRGELGQGTLPVPDDVSPDGDVTAFYEALGKACGLPVPDASAFDEGEVFAFLEIGGPGAAPAIADGQVVTGRPAGDGVWFTFVCVR